MYFCVSGDSVSRRLRVQRNGGQNQQNQQHKQAATIHGVSGCSRHCTGLAGTASYPSQTAIQALQPKDSMAVLNRAAGNGAPCSPTSRDQCKSHWSIPMKLRRNEYCPIHRSLFCCGREQARKERRFQLGVQRIEDPHHPRGYRELRSPAEMRKAAEPKDRRAGREMRNLPHRNLPNYSEIVPDHKHPKGMGGAWRDDHPENIQAVHWWCNSKRAQTDEAIDDRSVCTFLQSPRQAANHQLVCRLCAVESASRSTNGAEAKGDRLKNCCLTGG